MTTSGIITMLLSIGFVWALLIVCFLRMMRRETLPHREGKGRD